MDLLRFGTEFMTFQLLIREFSALYYVLDIVHLYSRLTILAIALCCCVIWICQRYCCSVIRICQRYNYMF